MGMQVYAHGVDVLIPRNYHRIAKKFVRRRKRRIYLQRESDNKDKSITINVIGKSRGWFFESRKCIGFVPEDVASKLVFNEMEKIKARLQLIAIEDSDYISIRIDILGPLDIYKKFCS